MDISSVCLGVGNESKVFIRMDSSSRSANCNPENHKSHRALSDFIFADMLHNKLAHIFCFLAQAACCWFYFANINSADWVSELTVISLCLSLFLALSFLFMPTRLLCWQRPSLFWQSLLQGSHFCIYHCHWLRFSAW